MDSPVDWDGEKFSNLNGTIGIVLGYSPGDSLKNKGFQVSDSVTDPMSNIKMLMQGRVEVILDAPGKIDFIIENNPVFASIQKLNPPYQVKPYYVMLSHKFVNGHPVLSEKIWDSIAKIRKSDQMKELLRKY